MLSVSYWTKAFRTFSSFPEEGLPFVEKVLSAAYSLLNVSSYLPNVFSINGNKHIQEIAIGIRYTHIEGASQDKKLSVARKYLFLVLMTSAINATYHYRFFFGLVCQPLLHHTPIRIKVMP